MTEPSDPQPAKQKPGPKPASLPVNRPDLAEEWADLRAWWAKHGALYNVREMARRLGADPIAIGRLLKGEGRHAATVERLDAIREVLSLKYEYPSGK